MNEDLITRMAEIMHMFSDSTRLKILETLRSGPASVGEIAQNIEMTQSSVSHQLALLRAHHLVKSRKEGKAVIYKLDDAHVEKILDLSKEHAEHL